VVTTQRKGYIRIFLRTITRCEKGANSQEREYQSDISIPSRLTRGGKIVAGGGIRFGALGDWRDTDDRFTTAAKEFEAAAIEEGQSLARREHGEKEKHGEERESEIIDGANRRVCFFVGVMCCMERCHTPVRCYVDAGHLRREQFHEPAL